MAWNVNLPPAEWYELGDPALPAIIRELEAQPIVAIDTETTGLIVWKDMPLFWSVAWGNRRIGMTIDTIHLFANSFRDETKDWVFANAKFDAHMLANIGVTFAGRLIDTQVMHALMFEEQSHKLDDMGKQLLGYQWKDMFSDWKKGQEEVGDFLMRMYREDKPKLMEYASNDAFGTLQIYLLLKAEMEKTKIYSKWPLRYPTMWAMFESVEVPFTRVLWKCERNGVRIDDAYLRSKESTVDAELDRVGRDITREAGFMLNPNSDDDIRNYFFKIKKYRVLKMTSGGKTGVKKPSVDKFFLEYYAEQGEPMAELLLRHSELSTIKNTYLKGWAKRVSNKGRLHTRFNQDVARTGRLSSSNPNLQNVKTPDKDEFKLRGAFVAEEGYDLIVGDYEQLEMRLLACATVTPDQPQGEVDLINIFLSGKDIHMGNAELVFGIPYQDLKDAKKIDKGIKEGQLPDTDYKQRMSGGLTVQECLRARGDIKSVGFGLNYGMKQKKLARQIKRTEAEAKDIIERYMGRYPAVGRFYQDAIEETRLTGYAFTILGRRRFLPEIASYSTYDRYQAERQAVNTQIQGTAADVVKMAMVLIDQANIEGRYGARMLLQVHDELVFECPKATAVAAKEEIKEWMEHALPEDLIVPLDVSIGIGNSWMTAKLWPINQHSAAGGL